MRYRKLSVQFKSSGFTADDAMLSIVELRQVGKHEIGGTGRGGARCGASTFSNYVSSSLTVLVIYW